MRQITPLTLLLTCITIVGAAPIPVDDVPAKVKLAAVEYNNAMARAKASYDADSARASRAFLSQLERAKALYMRDSDLEGANAVQAMIDNFDGAGSSALDGDWAIKYLNGATRVYRLDGSKFEAVSATGTNGRSETVKGEIESRKDNEVVIRFTDGKLERITLAGERLLVEHFNPASGFPDSFVMLGRGQRSE